MPPPTPRPLLHLLQKHLRLILRHPHHSRKQLYPKRLKPRLRAQEDIRADLLLALIGRPRAEWDLDRFVSDVDEAGVAEEGGEAGGDAEVAACGWGVSVGLVD